MVEEKKNLFERGSEWRKLDLHIHTPASSKMVDNDYKNMSVSAELFAKKLKEKDISVVAITDHHITDKDWIENIRTESNKINHKITILPGMEIRTELEAKENIHLIAIFSEESEITFINSELQSKLDITSSLQKGCNKDEIFCDYKKTIKIIKELGGVISVHCGKKANGIDDLINNDTAVKHAIKDKMTKEIDIFEIGDPSGDIKSYKSKVFPEINRKYPLIFCSDNHNINDYYKDKSVFTWIKADPTFEGLKQILYEPEERVKVQEDRPDEKEDCNVIDSVTIKNKAKAKDENNNIDINKETIYNGSLEIKFNQNLTSIIVEKSSGKSLLLYLLTKNC